MTKRAESTRQGQAHDGRDKGRGGGGGRAQQGGGRGGVGGRSGRGRASNTPSEETSRVSAGGDGGDGDQEDYDEEDDDDDWIGARRRLKAQAGTAEAPPGTTFAFWAGSHVGEGSMAGRRIANEGQGQGGRGGGRNGVTTGKGGDDDDSSDDDSDDEPLHQHQPQHEHEEVVEVEGALATSSISAPLDPHTLTNTPQSEPSESTGATVTSGASGQLGMQGMQEATKGEAHVHVSGSLLSGGGRRSRVGGIDPMEGGLGLVRKGTRTRSLLG